MKVKLIYQILFSSLLTIVAPSISFSQSDSITNVDSNLVSDPIQEPRIRKN
jgi:hypothetical protein